MQRIFRTRAVVFGRSETRRQHGNDRHKHNRWVDTVLMQRALGAGDAPI